VCVCEQQQQHKHKHTKMKRFISLLQCTALECGGCAAPPKTVCGIGAVLQPNEHGELEVVDLVPGGAAETSGLLKVGDILHEVDGVDMYKLPAKEVGEFIRGEVGTKISLGVAKRQCGSGTVYIETVELVRSEAKLPPRTSTHSTSTIGQRTRSNNNLMWDKQVNAIACALNNGGMDCAGIGAVLTKNGDDLEFSELVEGGPADSCGQVDVGDVVTEVDGVNIEKKPLTEVGNMIRGDAGTTVCLAVAKDGDRDHMVFPVIIRDCTSTLDRKNNKVCIANVAAKAAIAAYVSFDPLDMTLCEPDLKHRPPNVCPVSTTTTVCITLSPR